MLQALIFDFDGLILDLSALMQLGVTAHEAAALEDSPIGVAAAKAAGLFCVAVPNAVTRHSSLAAADRQFASLAEVSVSWLASQLPQYSG